MSYLPLHPGLRISVSQVEFLPWIEKKLKSYSKYFSFVFLNCISQCGTCGRECCNLLLNYVACCVSQSYVLAVFLKVTIKAFLKCISQITVFLKCICHIEAFLKCISQKKYFWNVFPNMEHVGERDAVCIWPPQFLLPRRPQLPGLHISAAPLHI